MKPALALPCVCPWLAALGLLAAPPARKSAGPVLTEAAGRIQADVRTLTSAELGGRRAGTPGGEAAVRFLAESFRKAGLLPAGDAGTYFQAFEFIDSTGVTRRKARAANVVGVLPGSDRSVNTEAVVVGARWDHIGIGADDGASGVAAILELARSFVPRRRELRRSLVIVAFGANEAETPGSLHFVQHPPVPADRIAAMVNLESVGRLRSGKLEVRGVGTSAVWRTLASRASEPLDLKLDLHEEVFGPSDHSPFAAAARPVLCLSTGAGVDARGPSDRLETFDCEGIATIGAFLTPIVEALLNAPSAPAFTKPGAAAPR
jgi:hypothetical protein